jgi:23S rRNA (adenine2503-C2)-methyltransferase
MLVDGFQLAPRKITISTVAPTPEAFSTLGKAPALLAWSVHSSRDEIRKELVPTTKYSMVQLRDALEHALLQRSSRGQRNIMLELALLQDINDSTDDALHLAEFCQPLLANVDGLKLTVNLIPWNDIGASHGPAMTYFKPSMDRVLAFQDALAKKGIRCYVRTTRGDEENAACGQLATESRREN